MRNSRWQYDIEGRQRFCRAVTKRSNWLIRDYTPGDEAEILRLCEHVFGEARSVDDWRWRTFENPAGKALIVIAQKKIGGQIVGHLAGITTDLKVGTSLRKAFFLVDSVVDPSHRGLGIHAVITFTLCAKCCQDDGGFGFGLPNKQAYLPTLKGGSSYILTLPFFFKVLDWQKVIQARWHSSFLAKALASIVQPFQRSTRPLSHNGLSFGEVDRFGQEADRLWDHVAPRFTISALRNATHLNWRYFQRPNSPYRVFSVSGDGEWKGYVVVRIIEKWGVRLGTLVDLFFDPDCAEAGALLIGRAETELRQQGADLLWGLFSVPESYEKLLRQTGFFRTLLRRTARPFHLVADFVFIEHSRPDLAERDGPVLRQGNEWFLSLGDTDLA